METTAQMVHQTKEHPREKELFPSLVQMVYEYADLTIQECFDLVLAGQGILSRFITQVIDKAVVAEGVMSCFCEEMLGSAL